MNRDDFRKWDGERPIRTAGHRFILTSVDDEFHHFYGVTEKYYGKLGQCYQKLHLSNDFIRDNSEQGVVDALDNMMKSAVDDTIEHAIAMGDLKKSDIIEGCERKQ